MKNRILLIIFLSLTSINIFAQTEEKADNAEPLVNDFTTDLGSPKGEGEVNFLLQYDALDKKMDLQPQLEVEYAPFKNFGLEVQVPYSINKKKGNDEKVKTQLPSIQWTAQYTIFSKPETNSSLAISYRNNLMFRESGSGLEQISHLPFLLYGKSLQERYYFTGNAGPEVVQLLDSSGVEFNFTLGGSFHYKFLQTNYIGFEYSQKIKGEESEIMLYPQYFNKVSEKLKAGAAIGIPLTNFNTKFSALVRVSIKI